MEKIIMSSRIRSDYCNRSWLTEETLGERIIWVDIGLVGGNLGLVSIVGLLLLCEDCI